MKRITQFIGFIFVGMIFALFAFVVIFVAYTAG